MLFQNSFKFRLFLFFLFAFGLMGTAALLNRDGAFRLVRYIDKNYLAEAVKDIRARFQGGEDWSYISGTGLYDYSWMTSENGLIRIAHGLGARPASNTLAAYKKSVAEGFSFFEVDLWLDGNNVIRCHHGPKPPPALNEESCTLERLIDLLSEEEYLVLDIKTDFQETAREVLHLLDNHQKSARVIFQLYLPEHVELFSSWAQTYQLAGPIVTTYESSRSLNHVFRAIDKAGIKAMTFPLERMPAITKKSDDILFFTHPVTSCTEMALVRERSLKGIYVRNDLYCEEG